jgi:hypothetical protein
MLPSNPLSPTRKVHKMNLIGRGEFAGGELEFHMGVLFSQEERAQAARVFEELKRSGYIQPTYDDLVDPENWVATTDSGREHLRRGARDHIDVALSRISPHLIELRVSPATAAGLCLWRRRVLAIAASMPSQGRIGGGRHGQLPKIPGTLPIVSASRRCERGGAGHFC